MVELAAMILLTGCAAPSGNQPRRDITVRNLTGMACQPLQGPEAIKVFIFITPDCPISNSYAPEINRLTGEYSARGVTFYLVHVDDDVELEGIRDHAQHYGYRGGVVLDPEHQLVHALGATVTPEAVVVVADMVAYRGRIDDRYVDFGKQRASASQRDLRQALEAALAGRPVPNPRTKAIGCFIPGSG